jgi:hypothetical protein
VSRAAPHRNESRRSWAPRRCHPGSPG